MAGGDGPEDMANASFLVIAGACDRGFGLFVADPFGDGIHSRLAGERVTQVQVLQFALREGEGRPERGGIEKIQCERGFLKALQLEQPAVPEIRRSFQRPVFAIVIVPRDGNGIMRVVEDSKFIGRISSTWHKQKSGEMWTCPIRHGPLRRKPPRNSRISAGITEIVWTSATA